MTDIDTELNPAIETPDARGPAANAAQDGLNDSLSDPLGEDGAVQMKLLKDSDSSKLS